MSANDTVGSPTTNTQETITDIIAANRSEADSIEQSARGSFKVWYLQDGMPFTEVDLERALDNAAHIRKEADRLEAALKRELESVSGNAAKLREATEAVLLAFNYGESTIVNQLPFSKLLPMLRKCIEALAAPPRNCDVGTAEEQAKRFDKFCHANINAQRCGGDCPAFRTTRDDCELVWAQLPYEAKEGGAK